MDDDNVEEQRYRKLGFKPQKEIIYSKFLPYADKLDDESLQLYTDIKTNLVKSVMLREIRPGCVLWVSRLNKYLKVYGFKFSKEDHIALIKLLFELVTIPDLEPTRVNKFTNTLTLLLKKKELISPSELELPWRPLYDLCMRIMCTSETSLGMYRYFSSLESNLDFLVHAARIYFPASATQEMLDEWRPKLCPYDGNTLPNTIELLERFLPITLPPSQAHLGYELWFKEFMSFWEVCHNAPPWECDMLWLMARLAMNNIGYIDWEPYIPLMFTRFLRALDLPVSYRQKQSPKHHKLEMTPIALWIISVIGNNSSALKYLEKYMQTVESYYHPANSGRWAVKLRELFKKLPLYFVQRLHRERYKKPSWESKVKESHRLTEEDIDKFVDIMKPVVVQAIYSRQGTSEVCTALQHLATLRPQVIIPLVLDKLYATLDSLTEPHKLTASMQCLVAVARPMLQGPKIGYPEGPTHVIPLLMSLLPGIDPNDIRKCFVTFQYISTFVSMIPLVDSAGASDHWHDLTEEEHAICEATASFEDFVLQFFDRVFCLVQSSSLEMTRLEQVDLDKKSKLEAMAESALSSICTVIITQTSKPIFKSALRKLYSFITQHILETKVAGQMAAVLCRSFIRVQPDDTLKVFMPYLCERIDELLGDNDEIKDEETLDTELLYNLLLVSEMIDCNGKSLLPYIDMIIKIIDCTLHLTCIPASTMARRLLNNVLVSLTVIQPMEYRSSPEPFYEDIKTSLPIRDWGAPGDINNLGMKWYEPTEKEIQCAQNLINRYLIPELDSLEQYLDGTLTFPRDGLRQNLGIITACLGAQAVLPMWDEPAYVHVPSRLEPWAFEMIVGTSLTISLPDGRNVRKTIADIMHRLQKKILENAEDDIKSLFNLIAIWDALIMHRFRGRDFESHWKNFHTIKKLLADCLRGGKLHLRQVLIDRVLLHQEFRTESRSFTFTETHREVLINMYQLCVSHYSEVRIKAQKKLFLAVTSFPYSYTVLTPLLNRSLQVDSNRNHEEFKGCLHVLLGPKSTPIISRHDWTFVRDIWPYLVTSKPSEKPSVINLMNAIVEAVHKHFPTISVKLEIPQRCLDAAQLLKLNAPLLEHLVVTEEEINAGITELVKISEKNQEMYSMLMNMLHDAISAGNLHWRYHTMALSLIRDLVHPNVKYDSKIVKYILNTLIHDSLEIRKLSIRIVVYILKQHKQKRKKIDVDPYSFTESTKRDGPGVRDDNMWMQYNSKTRPLSAEEWDKPRYLHKQFNGYYTWPKTVKVYACYAEQPKVDRTLEELTPQEKEIDKFFSNKINVDNLIRFLAMEEKKGRDKFNGYRFILFKNLFRNHGDKYFYNFIPHLERLVVDKEEHNQRCAAEIISAVIRGSKHWPYEKVENLWKILTPILRKALSNVTVETISDWGICFATASEGRDPNRHHWLYELLMEEPLREEASFIECGRMYTLQGALNQQVWRVSELIHRLFIYLQNYMIHPFQNVRDRVSSVLTNIFETDLVFPGSNPTNAPRISDFIADVMPKLEILYVAGIKDVNNMNHIHSPNNVVDKAVDMLDNIQIKEDGKDAAIRLFKTVCKWIIGSISRANFGSVPEFYELFPLACLLQSYEADEELSYICSSMLGLLAQSLTLAKHIPVALKSIKNVAGSSSWSARAACAEFIQVLVFHNMAILLSNSEWVEEIKCIVLQLLEDDKPEVRIQASQVLGGLLHCQFIPSSQELLDTFKLKSKTKITKIRNTQATTVTIRSPNLRVRHCGVLGMCAFINAHPYDVPDFLPDVFLQLGAHLNDPQPIPTTIRKTLGDFKRTHHDNWEVHQLKFTEDELSVLSDLTVPPSYYA